MLDLAQCRIILGVKPTTSVPEIKKTYHDLVKVWHPDRFSHDPALAAKAQEKLKEINEAYALLMRSPSARPETAFQRKEETPRVGFGRGFPWGEPTLVFALLLVMTGILFCYTFSVFTNRFYNPSPGKTVRDIA